MDNPFLLLSNKKLRVLRVPRSKSSPSFPLWRGENALCLETKQ